MGLRLLVAVLYLAGASGSRVVPGLIPAASGVEYVPPPGWVGEAKYINKEYGVQLDFPPTETDNNEMLREFKEVREPQFLAQVAQHRQLSANAQTFCENAYRQANCVKSLLAFDRQNNGMQFEKPKYYKYMGINPIGMVGGAHESVNSVFTGLVDDTFVKVCREYNDMWNPEHFEPGGKHFEELYKINIKLDYQQDLKKMLQNDYKGKFMLFPQAACKGGIDAILNHIRIDLGTELTQEKWLELRKEAGDDISRNTASKLRAMQIRRQQYATKFNALTDVCRTDVDRCHLVGQVLPQWKTA